MKAHPLAAALAAALAGCVDATGGHLVTYQVAAAGPADVIAGQPYQFDTGLGFHVSLTRARLHVGAVYLNLSMPSAGAGETTCILPGIYTGEELSGLDVDVLSPTPQAFPTPGTGTDDHAVTGEVWLTGGDVNATSDPTLIVDIAGTATRAADSFPFEGTITISSNRAIPPSTPSMPSQHPICKQRIVTPIPVDITPSEGGTLLVRVDPRGWFANVDFSLLTKVSDTPLLYRFGDDDTTAPDQNLFTGVRAAARGYAFSFSPSTP